MSFSDFLHWQMALEQSLPYHPLGVTLIKPHNINRFLISEVARGQLSSQKTFQFGADGLP
jgi:hypothetical protein